jgi:hypothetical protein
MQPHPIEPNLDAPLVPTPAPPVGSVVGMGLTDVLRVELQPSQVRGLIEEVDELYRPLTETFERARANWEAVSKRSGADVTRRTAEAAEELSAASYSLRVLAAIRAQVPEAGALAPVVIVGPTSMLSRIVAGATHDVVANLGELIGSPSRLARATAEEVLELARTVSAWVATYADCHAVAHYSFDPNWDPVRAD